MKVAILGGTGFLGSYLVDALIAHGYRPALLARPGSEKRAPRKAECAWTTGEIHDKETLRRLFSGCEAVIYNIGILREFPRRGITFESLQYAGPKCAMDVATELGVTRFLLTSANGVKPDGTPYQRTKYRAEEYLRASALAGTVFRPSVIFGDPRGRMEFATQLYKEIIRAPLPAPLFHEGFLPFKAGRFRVSPIHVQDVAEIYVKALENPEAIHKTYTLCGPEALEWRAIMKIIGRAVGRNKWTVPVPVLPIRIAAALLERSADFPLTRDQLTMLLEGNTGDSSDVFDTYGITPTAFDEDALSYLAQ
uniref:NADH dehydrogenase n=1 Tax=Candidatus Kentrum sp. LPFa TaxID=2126335 RepID=A0A450WER7_9GAMM|nr:MAG: NADH dehydrogenase [Candidatus Kentron sp. LPFa]VFK31209.1 MAG: NADH dehydrogenase [Candidatus Kentron sp. LPFa]